MSIKSTDIKGLEPENIKKAIYKTAVQRPGTVYSGAGGVLAGLYGVAFGFNPFVLALAGLCAVATIGSGVFEVLVKGDNHANDYVERMRKALSERRATSLKELTIKLNKVGDKEGLKQVDLFRDKYDNFVGILDQKLSPGELTYNRYLTIAEQVFLGGLDNLEQAALAIDSISAIDVDHLQQEIIRIESLPTTTQKDMDKLEQLSKRMSLHKSQVAFSEDLLHKNEHALTQLDHVTTKIANINTQQGRADVALEDAMGELKHLIDRAENYSN